MITVNFEINEEEIARLNGKLKEFCVEVVQDLNEEVVRATPYITGNLRGSWYADLNSEPDSASGPPDIGGGAAVARLNLVVADLKLGDVYYAINGAAYAGFVEYGTSKMAPRAYVRGTVDRADAIAEAALARVAET